MKKKTILLVVSILGVIGIVFGLSYAWFVLVVQGNETNTLKTGELKLVLNETGTAISLMDAFPETDEDGMKETPFTFSLQNQGNKNVTYRLKLLYDEASCNNCKKMPLSAIKFALTKNGVTLEPKNLEATQNLLEYDFLNGTETNTYELRLWMDENTGNEAVNAYFYGKLEVEVKQAINVTPESCFTFNAGKITGYDNNCPKDVVIPSSIGGEEVTTIGTAAFQSKQLTSLVLPNTLTTLEADTFRWNKLKSIIIPNSITNFGENAFQGNQLTEVKLSEGLTSIGIRAFRNNQINSIYIPKSVTQIQAMAFNGNLLPDNQAFIYKRNSDGSEDKTTVVSYGGKNRANVVVPNNVKTLENQSLAYNEIKSITIPSTVTSIKTGALNSNQLPDDQAFIYKRNSDGSEDKTVLVSYGGKNRANIIIPSNIKTLESYSLYNCGLTGTLNIPEGITKINRSAVSTNSLTEITLPNSLTDIGMYAFAYNQLTNITIPSNVVNLGGYAFTNNKLTSVKIKGKANSSAFTTYGTNIFGWATGYSDSNITWNG